MKKTLKEKINFYLFFIAILSLYGCGLIFRKTSEKPLKTSQIPKKILVLPFLSYNITFDGKPALPYFTSEFLFPEKIENKAFKDLPLLLKKQLQKKHLISQCLFLSQKEYFTFLKNFYTQKEYQNLLTQKNFSEKTLKFLSSEFVKYLYNQTGIPYVLAGKVFRYEERNGTDIVVRRPASVSFALLLYNASSGNLIWQGLFDETQEPIFNNLLKLKLYKSFLWLKVKDLAERGMEEVFKDFPLK